MPRHENPPISDESPSFEIPPQDLLWNQKANGRPGFHESAILLLRQGMVAGTNLPLFPAPLPALPRHISDKTLENDRKGNKEWF
jgi:hypothetical protein